MAVLLAGHGSRKSFPPEWLARLREVDPIRESVSYLEPRWHEGAERWILYEMVPAVVNNEILIDRDLYKALNSTDPLLLAEDIRDSLHQAGMSPYQWQRFQETRRYARPCWVIQGTKGGHLYAFDIPTRELAMRTGLPQEPPRPGDLPYAPFDERVVRQVLNMNRLVAARNDLAELKRNSTTESWKAQVRTKKQEARAVWVQWIEEMFADVGETFNDAYRQGEFDAVDAPIIDANELQRKDEEESARFIETGNFT